MWCDTGNIGRASADWNKYDNRRQGGFYKCDIYYSRTDCGVFHFQEEIGYGVDMRADCNGWSVSALRK